MRLPFALALLAASVSASRPSTEELQNKLRLAPNAVQRISLLDKDDDFVFNFVNPPEGVKPTVGRGGRTVSATGTSFPALIGTGMAMTVGFLGPCGLNLPHSHPRGTEFTMLVAGQAIRSGLITENGARVVMNDVPLGSATIFPQGSIHFQQNLGCDPAIFVAAFNSEDPGTSTTASRFFELHPPTISASLGGVEIYQFTDLELPANIALGSQDCLDMCGIDRHSFNFTDTTKFNWNATAALLAELAPPPAGHRNAGLNALAAANGDGSSGYSIPFSENPLRMAVIGLSVACGVLLLILIASALRSFVFAKKENKRIHRIGALSSRQPLSDSFDPAVVAAREKEAASQRYDDPYDTPLRTAA